MMRTPLAKQLSARMKVKNLSPTELERAAGLKRNAVQHILRGGSRKPSAELLQAIVEVLGCTIKDLLSDHDIFSIEESHQSKGEMLERSYEYPNLLLETVKVVHEKLKGRKNQVTNHHVLTCIEEIFLHSLQKDPRQVDQRFTDWFMDIVTAD